MSVKITVKGLNETIKKLKNMTSGSPPRIIMGAMNGLELGGRMIAQKIMDDPNVPEDYKTSIAVIRLDNERKVVIGPVLDYAYLLEYGREASWLLYRCPKEKYFGGRLSQPYTASPILEPISRGSMSDILDFVKSEVNKVLRGISI